VPEPGLIASTRPYLRQVTGLLVIGSLAGIAMNTAVVLPAVFLGHAIDVVLAVDRGAATAGDVTRAAVLVIAGSLATELPRIGKRWWLGIARNRIRASLRADAVRGVLAEPADRVPRTAVGDVLARVIGDVDVVGTGLGEVIVETWDTLLFSASLVVAMALYDLPLAAMALLPVPIALLLAKAAGRRITVRTIAARQANAAVTGYISEHLAGIRTVRALGRTNATSRALRRLADRQADAELAATALNARLQPVYAILTVSGVVAVLWLGGRRVTDGALSVGALVAFLQLFIRFTGRAYRIPQMANRVQAARAAHTRLQPLLAPAAPGERWSSWRSLVIPAPRAAPTHRAGASGGGPVAVRLDRVHFAYPGRADLALCDVSLHLAPGEFVAVTGPVGAGKSALASIVAGLFPVRAGTATVDGQDPYRWTDHDRAVLGYLPQRHPVFSGTVRENVSLFDPARPSPDPRTAAAMVVAGLADDLVRLPAGDATPIGELGVRVSGGQRQRIALARAIAAPGRPPGLLVLDDPFSAVDVATELRIIAALREQRATVLLCSTRLSAFPLADRVVVLDAGRVVEQGRHEDLLADDALYARIYRAQRRVARPDGVRP